MVDSCKQRNNIKNIETFVGAKKNKDAEQMTQFHRFQSNLNEISHVFRLT